MKKVLIIIPTLLQGGGQKFVLDLAQGLSKSKYEIKILVYYDLTAQCFEERIEELSMNRVDIVKMDKRVGLDFSFFRKVKKIVSDYKPDVIHTHLDVLLYLLPVFRKSQVKLHTVHTVAQKESKGLQKLVRNIAFKLFKVQPVAISETVAASIKEYFNLKNVPIVHNGVVCANYAGEKTCHAGKFYCNREIV